MTVTFARLTPELPITDLACSGQRQLLVQDPDGDLLRPAASLGERPVGPR